MPTLCSRFECLSLSPTIFLATTWHRNFLFYIFFSSIRRENRTHTHCSSNFFRRRLVVLTLQLLFQASSLYLRCQNVLINVSKTFPINETTSHTPSIAARCDSSLTSHLRFNLRKARPDNIHVHRKLAGNQHQQHIQSIHTHTQPRTSREFREEPSAHADITGAAGKRRDRP